MQRTGLFCYHTWSLHGTFFSHAEMAGAIEIIIEVYLSKEQLKDRISDCNISQYGYNKKENMHLTIHRVNKSVLSSVLKVFKL